jgi:hypothetical protein
LQNDLAKLFEPDILTGPRFFQAHGKENMADPERALLLAVLSEAIETFRKFAFSKSARGQVLFRQAAEWLWDKDPDYFFSCENICEVMGLDPCYLRRGLLRWAEQTREATRRCNVDKIHFARISRTRHRTVYRHRCSAIGEDGRDSRANEYRDGAKKQAARAKRLRKIGERAVRLAYFSQAP